MSGRDGFFAVDVESTPILASAADDMTASMICEIVRMAPLLLGIASSLDMKKCPPALLHALVLDK